MASARPKAPATGSAQWIQRERDYATGFVAQEVEEFGFSVRNEMEWMNEHMAEIFTKTQMNFAEVFKTPGKLRGKTPRTTQKRDALLPRQPLGDIFAPNPQPAKVATPRNPFYEKVAQFVIAEDSENQQPDPRPVSRGKSPFRVGKAYIDSGYHGMTEDELDEDARTLSMGAATQEMESQPTAPVEVNGLALQTPLDAKSEDIVVSDESFVSAKEQKSDVMICGTEERVDESKQDIINEVDAADTADDTVSQPQTEMVPNEEPAESLAKDVDVDMEDETPRSETSSPEKPLQRKSSFTFSALPAREPLTSKRSMGMRTSQTGSQQEGEKAESSQQTKSTTQLLQERITLLGKTKEPRSSKSIPHGVLAAQPVYPQLPDIKPSDPEMAQSEVTPPAVARQEGDDNGDWIAPTRSLYLASASQAAPDVRPKTAHASPVRLNMHQKSISTTNINSPSRYESIAGSLHQKAMSVSQINLLGTSQASTTPIGSPVTKKQYEGPLSASKNRLWSALKSAKNIFASSASTSAAAKLEAHNSSPVQSRPQLGDNDVKDSSIFNMPGAMYPEKQLPQSPARPKSVVSESPTRKTRSSTESDRKRDKEVKAQQKIADDFEKAREKERIKAAKQQEERQKATRGEQEKDQGASISSAEPERPGTASSDQQHANDMPPPTATKSALGKLRAPGRVLKPSKEALQTKPAPVSIRVASQAQRFGQGFSASTLSRSQHESTASGVSAKDSTRAPSAQGSRSNTAAPTNARLKALEAAARKKEAEEKAAQKKAEQKRELERKRAAKAEEERRVEEERKAAEQQRAQEARLAAQKKAEKQAADARKREQERLEQQKREQERLEQQRAEQHRRENELREQQMREREMEQKRQQDEARKAKEAHDLADAIKQERAQQSAHPRADVPGTLRQLTKNSISIQPNPAKPVKRHLVDDGETQQPQRPGFQRAAPSYQQTEAKRRRTNEEHENPDERHSVMAPPKRPSTFRKETLSKFPHGYAPAPPPGSMYKSTINVQHHLHHVPGKMPSGHPSQMVQISNARIPFAESSNNQASYSSMQQASQHQQHYHTGYETGYQQSAHHPPSNKFKTPARPAMQAPKSAKSTPSYPNGDNIELPDIATDSEDEDSEDEGGTAGGFRAPSWVASPALRDLLTQQQLVDPETVFGPIGELKMEEVFRNGKNQERLKRFRDRGSSAAWIETGDAVTSAEKKRDMELRERVAREGGWRYEPSH